MSQDKIQSLLDLLPHGSGINGTWHIEQKKRNLFYARNEFESMNENGYYCHCYRFTVIIRYNGKNQHKPCEYCHETGKRYIFELSELRHEHYMQTVEYFVLDRKIPVYGSLLDGDDNNTPGQYILCPSCDGKGYTVMPEFELLKLNFHGQKEYQCCGYGLKDYLYETIQYSVESSGKD